MHHQLTTLLVPLLLTLLACTSLPVYEAEGWTLDQYQPETLEVSKATLEGHALILPKAELLEAEGEPHEYRENCSHASIMHHQGRVALDCWFSDSSRQKIYYIYQDTAFLQHLDFQATGIEVVTPQITLSKHTRLRDIRRMFPNAWAHRNIGANARRIHGYEWVYLNDDLPTDRKPFAGHVELSFKNGKLHYLDYRWQPTYTQEQWDKYLQQRKEYEERQEK